MASPSKRRRERESNKENPRVPLPMSPLKPTTPQRLPLSPRKHVNICASNTPNLTSINSPAKARALDFGTPERKPICVTPTQNRDCVASKARALNFDSPIKGDSSPRKSYGTPRPVHVKPLTSPLRLAKQDGLCYQRAKQALHTAAPKKLLCREDKMEHVRCFLDDHLGASKPGSLYISGAPGTGKTAVLTHTMEGLKAKKQELVYVNCMTLHNSQAIYNHILSELKGKPTSLNVKQASAELDKILVAKGNMIVMVLDEMDQLDSKNQEILYTMFEWPSLPRSRLVLIGIANALDLTDRILPRLQARPKCRPQLLHFPPYTRDQIVIVLTDRLSQVEVEGYQVLESSAIKFCASKVASVAGDMRKALDVCRRAVEVVDGDVRKQRILSSPTKKGAPPAVPKKIGIPHILRIVNEVYGSRMVTQSGQQNTIPLQQKLAICSLLLLFKTNKGKEATLGKLHDVYRKVCLKQSVPAVDQGEFLSTCSLVEARGIMGVKKAKETRQSKVTLKLDESELESALQDKTLMSNVLRSQGVC